MVLAGDGNLKDKVGDLIDKFDTSTRSVRSTESGIYFVFPRRLTDSRFLSKVNKLGCEASMKFTAQRPIFFCFPPVGGRTIGSTSDSDSDYPGSSPGLPATLLKSITYR